MRFKLKHAIEQFERIVSLITEYQGSVWKKLSACYFTIIGFYVMQFYIMNAMVLGNLKKAATVRMFRDKSLIQKPANLEKNGKEVFITMAGRSMNFTWYI